MSTRNVVVAMPFGRKEAETRKAKLNFKRLKYIIENKCQVFSSTGMHVVYDVDVAKTEMDDIAREALKKIYNADILIVLLSERNITVTYELGYRRARKTLLRHRTEESETPVILMVDSKDDVPVYEAGVAYQSWRQDDVLEVIDSIAGKDYPLLPDFQVDIPGALKDVIDARDDQLIKNLEKALQEIEDSFEARYIDPVQKLRAMLSNGIDRFYPFSIVEVRFSKKGVEDPTFPPEVIDFDEPFSSFYGYGGWNAADKDGPLTLEKLLDRIEPFSDADDWKKFMEEQVELTETVIRNQGFARAHVPIRINSSHTDYRFKCKSFLPCIAAKVIDGELNGPHRLYLLIEYIEI